MKIRNTSTSRDITTRIVAVSIGLILMIPAGHKLMTYCTFRFLGNHAEGLVIHSSSGRDMGGRPFLQYLDSEGGLHEFKTKAKTHWFTRPAVGERMDVFIDRNDPDAAIVNNHFYYVYFPLLLFIVGGWCCFRGIRSHEERDAD